MGKVLLVSRLAARDLRHRPAQAVLLLLAITAATTVLTLGLALHGVTSQPYQQTQAATNGPDVVAQLPVLHQPGRQPQPPPPGDGADPRSRGHRPQRALPARRRPGAGRQAHGGRGGRRAPGIADRG